MFIFGFARLYPTRSKPPLSESFGAPRHSEKDFPLSHSLRLTRICPCNGQIRPPPPPSTFTSDEINARLDLVTQSHTLRARADDRLAAIFDYERAVSFTKGTARAQIFCHSNLHFLPPTNQFGVEEYPLFQTADLGGRTNSLEFVALVRVVDVEIRQPHSPELLKLLKAKFGDGARDPVAWKKSLEMPWAVVTLEKVEGGKNPMH